MKKTRLQKDEEIKDDITQPIEKRRESFERIREAMLNPLPKSKFDPETFDPMDDHPDSELGKRERIEPPKRLPTMGMFPKNILNGQMVGMFESKQDLYLLIAWLSNRVTDLEEQITQQNETRE